MAYGARFYNASGEIQITQDYQNLALRNKTVLTTGGRAMLDFYPASVTYNGSASSILAFSCAQYCVLYSTVLNSNGTRTATFYAQGSGVSITVWIFDLPEYAAVSGNYGMKILRLDGSTAFDSRCPYMRVIGQIAGSEGSSTVDNGVSYSYSKSPIAVVQGALRTFVFSTQTETTPGNFNYTYTVDLLCASISGAQVSLKDGRLVLRAGVVPGAISLPPSYTAYGYSYLILDVTNM